MVTLVTGQNDDITTLHKTVEALTRQLMMQQLFVEERIRSDGDSGIKQIRHTVDGTRPYYGQTHSGPSVAAIHDHANNDRTVGMGENVVVLNGVEFRTRHNDYRLRKPHQHDKKYHALEDIPFPPVPPEVLAKSNVTEQVAEMKEWFKAWKTQDHKQRDYRQYFKPVLCYLEGAWTVDTKHLSEPFVSDRHHLDASSWYDLQEKIRFTSYTGSKSNNENYAFLPSTIMNVNNGTPEFAQWNYRIACHPLNEDLLLNRFQLVDDLSARMYSHHNLHAYSNSRAARFTLNPSNTNYFHNKHYSHGFLDKLMEEIPGKDNYPAHMEEDAFGLDAYEIKKKNLTKINTGYYHRIYRVTAKGAMGLRIIHRGFSDANLFFAETTQPRIASMSLHECHKDHSTHHHVCADYTRRYSYAIPLEVIYLTPLYNWNPYNLESRGKYNSKEAHIVTLGGRNGDMTADKAYNGTHSKLYYKTPVEMFQGGEVNVDVADTAKGAVGVLDQNGVMRKVVASGTRIFIPNIPGIGPMRTRYPIMPVHGEGGAVWKELDALKDIMMNQQTYIHMFEKPPLSVQSVAHAQHVDDHEYSMDHATRTPPGDHTHYVYLTDVELAGLKNGTLSVKKQTSQSNNHSHELVIGYNNTTGYVYVTCDDKPMCWDGHGVHLHVVPSN